MKIAMHDVGQTRLRSRLVVGGALGARWQPQVLPHCSNDKRGAKMKPKPAATESRQNYWRVAIVEDHLLQRRRTEQLLGSQRRLRVVHSCETMPEFLAWFKGEEVGNRPHLLIMDLMV